MHNACLTIGWAQTFWSRYGFPISISKKIPMPYWNKSVHGCGARFIEPFHLKGICWRMNGIRFPDGFIHPFGQRRMNHAELYFLTVKWIIQMHIGRKPPIHESTPYDDEMEL
jgi:hypothetical protein